jgi:hypothetical protein
VGTRKLQTLTILSADFVTDGRLSRQAGHFKCHRLECCNKTYPSADELALHLRTPMAGSFSPRQPVITINQSLQSPPVQQLQQQVSAAAHSLCSTVFFFF